MSADAFLKQVKKEILSHPVMLHRFWKRFEKAEFSRKGLRSFALHYYLHVLQTRLYDAMVLARTPSEPIQAVLASILGMNTDAEIPTKHIPSSSENCFGPWV